MNDSMEILKAECIGVPVGENQSVVETEERSKMAVAVLFLLTILGLRLLFMAITYLLCLYRFLSVWHHIFRIHNCAIEEEEPVRNPKRIQEALVNESWSDSPKREEHSCPICLIDFGR